MKRRSFILTSFHFISAQNIFLENIIKMDFYDVHDSTIRMQQRKHDRNEWNKMRQTNERHIHTKKATTQPDMRINAHHHYHHRNSSKPKNGEKNKKCIWLSCRSIYFAYFQNYTRSLSIQLIHIFPYDALNIFLKPFRFATLSLAAIYFRFRLNLPRQLISVRVIGELQIL